MDMGDWTTSSSAEPSAYNTPSTTPTPTPVKKTEYICRWDGCGHEVDASADLADHVTCNHAQAQIKKNAKKFICLWDGCKVYNTPSLSQTWLLKHVLDHCGAKPFRCLFSGCNQSFRTQSGQERHVQSHFSASEQPSPQQRTSRSKDDSPGKITKKKRSRMKKRLSLHKPEDFFDTGMVDILHHKLVELNRSARIHTDGGGLDAVFHSKIVGRRKGIEGCKEVLLTWQPSGVLPNKWVKEEDLDEYKEQKVPLCSLPKDSASNVYPGLVGKTAHEKQRRK
ncbi:zinc finger protein AEBP2-like [Apostichopus japonicus]|uniref:zinc finger protein AEBP2-like n=1 Tax=Stichopus japonicus TaxID=307972 RepID=UPI003AB289CD